MIQGIAIFGLNGGGKSTLTHALAKQLDGTLSVSHNLEKIIGNFNAFWR